MSLRILTVTHFFESHGGGIERVAAKLNLELARLGNAVSWAASDADPGPVSDVKSIPLRCSNPLETISGLPMPIPGIRAIRALISAVRQCDVVIIHDALYITSIVAMLVAKFCGKRVLLIQHIAGIPFSSTVMRFIMRVANMVVTQPMLRTADRRVFISETVRRDLLGNRPRSNSRVIFNGVDTNIFYPRDSSPRDQDLTSPRKMTTVLFVGRFVEKKGLSIIEALARSRPDFRFVLVGSGPIRPKSWRLENVDVVGNQSQAAIAGLYREADIFLLPSVGEGYPLVVQEAMACGVPIICGLETSYADPGATCWLRGVVIDLADPSGSASRCAAAIDASSTRPTDVCAMAKYAAQTYSWSGMALTIEADLHAEG